MTPLTWPDVVVSVAGLAFVALVAWMLWRGM